MNNLIKKTIILFAVIFVAVPLFAQNERYLFLRQLAQSGNHRTLNQEIMYMSLVKENRDGDLVLNGLASMLFANARDVETAQMLYAQVYNRVYPDGEGFGEMLKNAARSRFLNERPVNKVIEMMRSADVATSSYQNGYHETSRYYEILLNVKANKNRQSVKKVVSNEEVREFLRNPYPERTELLKNYKEEFEQSGLVLKN
ncbi:hypothetical protein Dip510_000181 [Elusimicrobium posterum]|uniref:hypothetical protein n=1 Tax=Elusimicrobium posterum TaxID=3116653 RepID=UPI003C77D80C